MGVVFWGGWCLCGVFGCFGGWVFCCWVLRRARLALLHEVAIVHSRAGSALVSVRCHSGVLRVQSWVAVGRLYVCDVLCMYCAYVLGVFFFLLHHVGVCPSSVCHSSVCHV